MHLEKTVKKMGFENALEKMRKNMWKKCEKNVKKCVKNVKKGLKIQLGRWNPDFFFFRFDFLGFQFCCSYFAACPTSAGWKSERSSSNRSEVDCPQIC